MQFSRKRETQNYLFSIIIYKSVAAGQNLHRKKLKFIPAMVAELSKTPISQIQVGNMVA